MHPCVPWWFVLSRCHSMWALARLKNDQDLVLGSRSSTVQECLFGYSRRSEMRHQPDYREEVGILVPNGVSADPPLSFGRWVCGDSTFPYRFFRSLHCQQDGPWVGANPRMAQSLAATEVIALE